MPGTDWTVWRDAVLRTGGFPADGLIRLAAPEVATLADEALESGDYKAFFEAYERANLLSSAAISEIAGDPLFREAVAWQNPALVPILATVAADPAPTGNNRARHKRRARELMVARYWQRYCAKNETIGFFFSRSPGVWWTRRRRPYGSVPVHR
ncbi:lantibiotic dehydratase [Fodinicola feengrottensis]|uniref:lantibiotic dehydratase n=1 Tax=Fodinicola feengrottensis TaxID=435914 RepID=UPI0024431279|nr:lantibiotic dehydratase [Fodinicola feengrottensis]